MIVALLVVTGLVIPLLVVAGLAGLGSGLTRLYALAVGSGLAGLGSGLTRLRSLAVGSGPAGLGSGLTRLSALAVGSGLAGLGSGLPRLYALAVGSGLAELGARLTRLYALAVGSGPAGLGSGLTRLRALAVGSGPAGLGSGLTRLYALAIGSRLAGTHRLTRLPPLAVSPGLPRTHPRLTRLYALTIGSRLAGTHRLAPGLTGLYSLAIGSRLVRPHPLAITARLAGTGSRSIGSGLSTRSSLSVSGIAAGLSARSALTFCALSAGLSVKWSRLRPRTKVPGLSARHSALSAFYRFRLGILRFPAINPIPARRTALTGRRLHSTPRRFGLLRLRSALSVRFFPIRRSFRFSVPGRLALIQTVCLQNRRNIGHNRRYPGLLQRRGRRIRLAAVKRAPSGYLLAAVQFIVVIIHLNFLLSLTGTEIPAFSNTPSAGYADSEIRLQKILAALRTQRCFEPAAYVPTRRSIFSPSAHSITYLTKKYNPPEFPDELHFPK